MQITNTEYAFTSQVHMNILKFKHFSKFSEIDHGVSTRSNGVSISLFSSLNLSYHVGDQKKNVIKNRRILSDYFGVKPSSLLFPNQRHTSNIQIVTANNFKNINLEKVDALICSDKNIAIGVLAADCIPILFFDSANKVIAAAHAGWRGTVKDISRKVISKLKSEFNSCPADIYVGIGPGISENHYEVDEKVISEVHKLDIKPEMVYKQSELDGHYYLNLAQLNFQLILAEEIPKKNIELMNVCTYSHPELFFSARRDGFNTGRFGSVIKLNSD